MDPSPASIEALQDHRFDRFLESAPDAVVIVDQDGKIVRVNGQAERMFGHGREELAGQEVEILMPERFRDSHRVQRAGFIAHPTTRPMGPALELWGLRKDGSEFPVEISLSPIPDHSVGILVASSIRDVTEQKRLKQELRDADRRKNEFLAILAHELRNPLAPLRNAVQLLRLTSGNVEAVASVSEMMERQVGQMVRLVDDLLDVSRISRGKIELRKGRIELAPVVNQAIEATRSLYVNKAHELTITLPPQPIFLNADPSRLAQVVGNLLNNACKFTDKGGRIWLTVEREGEQAVIRVRDSGIGIAADQLSRIFDMFTQVDSSLERSESGLGIGLSLVKSLVEMHGGTVEIHSAGAGHGSEFVVRLPIMVEAPEPPPPEPTVSDPTTTTSRRILVVDDNRDSATSLAMLLEITGNETHTAFDGLEAVEAAATFKPDVVLLDIGLPKLNGYEACRRIRQQPWGKNIVMVALTGWGHEEDREKSRDAGFNSHMVKPVELSALTKLLADLSPTPV